MNQSGRQLLPVLVITLSVVAATSAQWSQWGGPARNFTVETHGLANAWPEDGPPRLWRRPLGDGFSSITVDDTGRLYTMYRKAEPYEYEHVIALDAKTGQTIWEHSYAAPLPPGQPRFPGPNATPLIVGDRLFTMGVNGVVHCLNKRDGKVIWKHDVAAEFSAPVPAWGFSPSPIAYKDTVIIPVGRPASAGDKPATDETPSALVAFDQADGHVVWKDQSFALGHSSPILINFAGQDQLVLQTMQGLIAVEPGTGKRLWQHPSPQRTTDAVIPDPVWNGEDVLFFTSDRLGCAVKLTKTDAGTTVTELWSDPKVGLGMATPICINGVIVGPKRGWNPFMLGVDFRTGKRLWHNRTCPMGPCIAADGKLITLDEDGWLGLATLSDTGLTLQSKCKVAERSAFTPPTLVGTTLYVRDRQHIMALDLGNRPSR